MVAAGTPTRGAVSTMSDLRCASLRSISVPGQVFLGESDHEHQLANAHGRRGTASPHRAGDRRGNGSHRVAERGDDRAELLSGGDVVVQSLAGPQKPGRRSNDVDGFP